MIFDVEYLSDEDVDRIIRSSHSPQARNGDVVMCESCGEPWPCVPIQALENIKDHKERSK